MATGGLWIIACVLLLGSFFKDRKKTKRAVVMAVKQFSNLLPMLTALVLCLGMVRSLIDPGLISGLIGPESGVFGIVFGLIIGSVLFLPGFVAFPMAAGFLEIGAGYPQVAGFIASLMSVGISTAPLEIKYFGMKLTVFRNLLCLATAIVFVLVIGGVDL